MDERDPLTFAVIGAAMEVHRELGHGFLESVYAEALALELTKRSIRHQREVSIAVKYKGQALTAVFRADLVVGDELLIEIKAVSKVTRQAESQLLHYLKATGLRKGLLVNFGESSLRHKRFVF